MKIKDLTPGDRVAMMGRVGIFIGIVDPHPLFPNVSMVIWWMPKEKTWYHDALSIYADMPMEVDGTSNRQQNLRNSLLDHSA
jgi:hypothetical protein